MGSKEEDFLEQITPNHIRYLKLGAGGRWVDDAFEHGELQFSHHLVPHNLCLKGDWGAVAAYVETHLGRSPGKAKDAAREIRDFYTLSDDCLWVTFARNHLWWAFAEPEVVWREPDERDRAPRSRKVIGTWSNKDVRGKPLRIDRLSTRLTQVAAYRQTLCRIKEEDYLLRRINGLDEPIVAKAEAVAGQMTTIAAEMIAGLHWADFEVLVDLIFARSGWQRVSAVGGSQKDVDLILEHPTTGERAFVQVKSKAGQPVVDDYINRYQDGSSFDRLFFVCHSPRSTLSAGDHAKVHLWSGEPLAEMAVKTGLLDWLIEKSS